MFDSLKKLIYYLWHGETKEEYGKRIKRIAEARAAQDELDRQNLAELQKEQRRRAAEERAARAKERAYQKFLKTHEVTRCDAPDLDDNAIREQRRRAMRFAKDMQDSMPD
jgi:DNA-binding helix-hairpin-helix protein with protein kinase domain